MLCSKDLLFFLLKKYLKFDSQISKYHKSKPDTFLPAGAVFAPALFKVLSVASGLCVYQEAYIVCVPSVIWKDL